MTWFLVSRVIFLRRSQTSHFSKVGVPRWTFSDYKSLMSPDEKNKLSFSISGGFLSRIDSIQVVRIHLFILVIFRWLNPVIPDFFCLRHPWLVKVQFAGTPSNNDTNKKVSIAMIGRTPIRNLGKPIDKNPTLKLN